MLISEQTVVSFIHKNIILARSLINALDLCFDFNIDVEDKQYEEDIDRICKYVVIKQVFEALSSTSNCVFFVDTGRQFPSKAVNHTVVSNLVATYRSMTRMLRHRFLSCAGCKIPSQPIAVMDLIGEIKDCVLLTSSKPTNNLSKIKKFVMQNRLLDIEQRIESSLSLSKILLFL